MFMKQHIFTGLAAGLLVTTVSVVSASLAGQDQEAKVAANAQGGDVPAAPSAPSNPQASNVVKVGEQQTPDSDQTVADTITRIHPYQIDGQTAVTLYVRNIPVVTFLGTQSTASKDGIKVAATENSRGALAEVARSSAPVAPDANDPLWRATVVAARINQLNQTGADAKSIKVSWDQKRHSYIIRSGTDYLLEITDQTLAPQKTKDSAQDVLQITNRLRQQLGETSTQTSIPGRPLPKPIQKIASAIPFQRGMASWYGPGFQGNPTASGERFNQYAMTAAHRGLAFGTRVRVTNLNNGRSTVVRINDRGPFVHGRIIDLSRGAAQAIGVVSSGVAPVRLEILQ